MKSLNSFPVPLKLILAAILLACVLGVTADDAVPEKATGPEKAISPEKATGPEKTTDIVGMRLLTVDGEAVHLGMQNGARPVALVFLNDGCTISRRYVPRLNEIAREADKQNVDVYGVISNPEISWTAARDFRNEYKLELPLLYDSNGEIARQVLPEVVPSAFVVDMSGRVTYRGRIDDRFPSLTKARQEARTHDLLQAIQAVAAGPVETPVKTQAVGCVFVPWPEREENPNYAAHIAPILNANCIECHQSGGVAPFPLDTYESAKRWSTMVANVTAAGLMPPWRAKRGVGHFREERFLTDHQLALLADWDRTDETQGDMAEILPKPDFPTDVWALGEPDLELKMPEPFAVPADGEDIYRYFVLPMELPEDVVIVAMDFKPGDATVVHHANFFVDYKGRGREFDEKDPAPGFSVFGTGNFMSYTGSNALGAWAPGVGPYQMPEGRGFDLPKGGDVVLEVHYHLTGKATTDQSSVAFYFAKGPVERGVSGLFVGTQDVNIPAGDKDYWRRVTVDIPGDMRLFDIGPHMHYLGREAIVTATLPNGQELPLLHVNDWDLRWQGIYTYRQPIDIPAGSKIEALFRFDNSNGNPANPNFPAKDVAWGWGSDEEMAEVYMTIVPKNRAADRKLQRASIKTWMRSADPGPQTPTGKTEAP